MYFSFKLPKRLAQSWTTRAVLAAAALLHLPIATTAALVTVSRFLSIRVWRSEFGNRRSQPNRRCGPRCRRDPLSTQPRLWDHHPCREAFLCGLVIQFAVLAIPKVAT
jgi:hypothetical protein